MSDGTSRGGRRRKAAQTAAVRSNHRPFGKKDLCTERTVVRADSAV